jgi:hypothetical protein
MSEQFFIRLRGRIQGPFSSDQLQSLAKRGQFSRTHEVSDDGVRWSRATTRPELFPPANPDIVSNALFESDELVPEPPPRAAALPPTDVWYYHQLGANHGPVDFSHLQYLTSSGQVSVDDVVWKEGLPEWIPAGRVPGLFKTGGAGGAGQPPVYIGVGQVHPSQAMVSEFPRVSGFSVASLVLGILWIAGIGSVLAIIFGAVAIHQIRLSKGRLTGTGLAVAGLVLGIVFLSAQIIVAIADQSGTRPFGN